MTASRDESEWVTRKRRIDPLLDAAGWPRLKSGSTPLHPCRTEEEETANGPADYALWLNGHIVAIVEAKKLAVSPQGVLVQAERYARGLRGGNYDFDGLRVPFLYSTNGQTIRFHDVRHPLNRSRTTARFHTPDALRDLLARDQDAAWARLLANPNANPRLRYYQKEANAAVEQAIADRKRQMLLAMATGTGKTFTLVNQVFRLLEAKAATRVLFLVDRRALAAQAVREFASFDAAPGLKFDKVYEVYSSRFQRDDFDEDDKFDPKILPTSYLTDPQPGHQFVYVCTVQRMAINLFGRGAIFDTGDEDADEDADKLNIPIHTFDVIIADECHRGYTAHELSCWRDTLDHFDAVKIGLTATPAKHTTSYFQHLVYRYDYQQALRDGHLVDYDVVKVRSDVRMHGLFLKEGEQVEAVDAGSGAKQLDLLEDDRHFDSAEIEAKITAPASNRKIIEEVKGYALAHEQERGRFPKTLIFAVNDLPHTSHADQLVDICRDVFGRGEAFVQKITGKVDRPLQRIREFRNRPNPSIAITVDLLSTGVDIPDLEFIVFLRPVKSRILFTQMLGRGTRKGLRFTDKSSFTVFDCFDGSLLAYFKNSTDMTPDFPAAPGRTIKEIVEDIWNNRDRDYNIGCLVKRLHRIDKQMSGEARDDFAAFIADGDLARYARELPKSLRANFAEVMTTLRDPRFQDLLLTYKRPPRVFYIAADADDTVASSLLLRADGEEYKPEDYLAAFARFVKENPEHIEAVRILLDRPSDWSTAALSELRQKLRQSRKFTPENLQKAHALHYHRALVDVISMVKHAADGQQPLLTAAERVGRAFQKITAGLTFTPEQQKWLDHIRVHLIENLSIDREDFELVPVLTREGGWSAARRVFGERLEPLLHQLNEAIAA
jgi:type I restriction enzyme, R subunit